uniref:HORMA domain-containing protein n=1 Tax=Sphenodon punctatus TaxID=8508 RepID=A0A8D0HRD1_SPHPU
MGALRKGKVQIIALCRGSVLYPCVHAPITETVLFPNRIATEQQSLMLVKRLLAISISCITYLRGLFPESSYGTRYLDDLCLKILREDKNLSKTRI